MLSYLLTLWLTLRNFFDKFFEVFFGCLHVKGYSTGYFTE